MCYNQQRIIDLRKDNFAAREKELCKLAEDILWQGAITVEILSANLFEGSVIT